MKRGFQIHSLTLAAFVFSLGLLGCSHGSPSTDLVTDRVASYKTMLFAEAKSATVAKLTQQDAGKGPFHGSRLASEWLELDASARSEVASLLQQHLLRWIDVYTRARGDYPVELMPFCVPDPGYAVHLETDRGPRDFLICLECGVVDAFNEKGGNAEFPLEDDELVKLKAAYANEFILGKGLKKKA